jgi:hypothetical protein
MDADLPTGCGVAALDLPSPRQTDRRIAWRPHCAVSTPVNLGRQRRKASTHANECSELCLNVGDRGEHRPSGHSRGNSAKVRRCILPCEPKSGFPCPCVLRATSRGWHPSPEVASVGATNWRCRDGKVYVCAGGAAGSACAKMDPSRQPSEYVRQTCEDNPGQDFVATAVIGNSSSTWRCQGPTAKIIMTVSLDSRGFMKQMWAPLFNARGNINAGVELGADPR